MNDGPPNQLNETFHRLICEVARCCQHLLLTLNERLNELGGRGGTSEADLGGPEAASTERVTARRVRGLIIERREGLDPIGRHRSRSDRGTFVFVIYAAANI